MSDEGQQFENVVMMKAGIFAPADDETVVKEQPMQEENIEVTEDILQQALQEAAEGFEQVEYDETEAINGDEIVAVQLPGQEGRTIVLPHNANVTYKIVDAGNDNQIQLQEADTQNGTVVQTEQYIEHVEQQGDNEVIVPNEQTDFGNYTIVQGNENANVITEAEKPKDLSGDLGSSENPIRIVQQGTQYHSMQQLTQEQLTQIMQVLQQQQLSAATQKSGGQSVLYNSQTNTRVVYRVMYPSELHKNSPIENGSATSVINKISVKQKQIPSGQPQVKRGPGRPPKRKRLNSDDTSSVEGMPEPELSREEKEERKKQRPRTRSGRVSRPPRHMTKDFKHVHVLDWNDDYKEDDSDGGYTDFKESDEENGENKDEEFHHPGFGSSKKKPWKCEKCEKCYIGRGGLARHYRMTGHGHLEEDPAEVEARKKREEQKANALQNLIANHQELGVQGAESGPVSNQEIGNQGVETVEESNAMKLKAAYLSKNTSNRRKARLNELMRQCTDEELMECVLPRLSQAVSMWEFLLMKVERGRPPKLDLRQIYTEYEALHSKVRTVCQNYLLPAGNTVSPISDCKILDMKNKEVAESLGMQVGQYKVKDDHLTEDELFQYKYLTCNPTLKDIKIPQKSNPELEKRQVQYVSRDQIITERKEAPKPIITVSSAVRNVPEFSLKGGNIPTGTSLLNNIQVQNTGISELNNGGVTEINTGSVGVTNLNTQNVTDFNTGVSVTDLNKDLINIPNTFHNGFSTDESIVSVTVGSDSQEVSNPNSESVHMINESETNNISNTQNPTEVQEEFLPQQTRVIQTEDGKVYLENPDGSLIELQHSEGGSIPLETVQALLNMENVAETQVEAFPQ
ncbi:unnamed protein product [Owenia fusiformis]|uniref:Uncharacterized protein n=1 Tax=Owenia fusiformis TaxID=6347 RepID=A0A8J1U1S3_OWEFU|nr:unnamed protein product [Owenia fusiformis]